MTRARLTIAFLYALFFLSGGAGLGYQMVWSKMFAAGLGHEIAAVLAVVGAFMGGMAIGAWALDRVVARSQHPERWYSGLELLIGGWGLVSSALIPFANRSALSLIGVEPGPLRHWAIAVALPFLVLLPATAAMGATFPAMERFLAPLTLHGRCVGALYAANTAGAVAGILGSAFVIIPALGLRQSSWVLAAINVLCGLMAWLVGLRVGPARLSNGGQDTISLPDRHWDRIESPRSKAKARPVPISTRRLRVTVFFTGLLGIGFETVSVRVLSQVLEDTIYTFAAVLSVFLAGAAIGSALYQRLGRRTGSPSRLADLLGAISLAGMLGVIAASHAQPIYDRCRTALGDGLFGVFVAELTVASAVLFVPTVFMGATFAHLVQIAAPLVGRASRRSPSGVPLEEAAGAVTAVGRAQLVAGGTPDRGSGGPAAVGVGRALALNTLGGAVSPVLFGVMVLPNIGSKWTLVLISFGYLTLLPALARWRWGYCALAFVLVFALPASLQVIQVPPDGRVVRYCEGAMASVAVVEDARRDRILRVDNRFQMGGTGAAAAEYRHAHIPLLLHPAPRHALFLGLGTGISFGAATVHQNLQSDGVELVPEIVTVMGEFEPFNFSPGHRPELRIFIADARRYVRATRANYDVIVADLFHPARDGAGSLYTLEHFRAIRERLAPGGLFCQWLPLYQLDEDMIRVIVRTFLVVYPNAQAWLLRFNVDAPVLGLLGSLDAPHYSAQWVEHRLSDPNLEKELKKLALADSVRLFGNLLAGPKTLRDFSGAGPLNTDDQPRVTFGAPRFVYRKTAEPYGRLLTLLKLEAPDPHKELGLESTGDADQFALRLTRYLNARDVYLNGLVDEVEGRESKAIDRFVESARLSDDFTTGYARCLTVASAWAKTKPAEARALLTRLIEAQPSRSVAREMLSRLFGP